MRHRPSSRYGNAAIVATVDDAMTDAATIPCSMCRTPIDPQTALYGDNGQVCDACSSRSDMADRIVRSCRSLSFSALGTAVASVFLNPFMLLTAGSIFTAVLAVRPYFSGDPDDRETLWKHPLALVLGVIAMLIAGGMQLLKFVPI
jgi:hypothetical protein